MPSELQIPRLPNGPGLQIRPNRSMRLTSEAHIRTGIETVAVESSYSRSGDVSVEGALARDPSRRRTKTGNVTLQNKCLVAYLVRPAEGGIKTHLLTLLAGLDTSRVEPVIICPPGMSLYRELEEAGYRTVPLDIVGELNPIKDFKAILRLRGILRDIRPDVLHIHSAKAGLVGRLAVVGTRRPRVLVSVHSFVFDERMGRLKRVVVGWIERRLLRWTDRIIAVSEALKKELISRMGLDPGAIQVIHNGIAFRDIPKPARSGMRIGTVSRLAPQKGSSQFGALQS